MPRHAGRDPTDEIQMEQTETRTRLKAGKLIAFGVVPAALILCLAEIGVRIWLARFASPGQFRKYSLLQDIPRNTFRVRRHHYLNFAPTPGWTKGLTSHNSLGYRSDEFPVKKPEGVFRIVLLGGSSTYTEFVRDNAKAWSAQLQRLLRGRYGYRNVQVISGGAPRIQLVGEPYQSGVPRPRSRAGSHHHLSRHERRAR